MGSSCTYTNEQTGKTSVKIRVIPATSCHELAPPDQVIAWVREAQIATSKGEAELPLRRALSISPDIGAIGMMPGYLAPAKSAGVKLVSLVPPARRKGSSHLGLFILYEEDGLVPVALLDGSVLTAIRTAAASAVATDALARKDASTLSILGTGEQAEAHIEALSKVRTFSRILVWGRTRANADALCETMKQQGYPCEVVETVSTAAENADVICTVTSSTEPILLGKMVQAGTHVNLVGSSNRAAREVDTELLLKSKIFLDYEGSARDQAGEILKAVEDGDFSWDNICGEIGSVLNNTLSGRGNADEITVYKSLGIAAQDVITAKRIFEAAEASDIGTLVSL